MGITPWQATIQILLFVVLVQAYKVNNVALLVNRFADNQNIVIAMLNAE